MGRSRVRPWTMLLLLLAPATLIMAIDRAVVTVAAPQLQARFDLSLSQLGLVFSIFFWAYAAMQLPASLVVQKLGSRIPLFVAIILWSLMTALTPLAGGFAMLLLVRALLGIGQSADWPGAVRGVHRLFDARRRPVANGILLCALYAGPVVGAPLTSHLLVAIGLEGLFLLCGGVGLVFALLWILFYHDGPRADAASPAAAGERVALRDPAGAWPILAAYVCLGFPIAFYLAWFPTYLAKARALSLDELGLYSATCSAALCIGVLIAGRVEPVVLRLIPRRRIARGLLGGGGLLVGGVLTAAVPLIAANGLMLAVASVAVAALAFAQVATWSTVQDVAGSRTAVLTGFVSLGGNVSAGAAPLFSAVMVERTGSWTASLVALGLLSLVGALLWLRIDPERRIDRAA